MRQRETCGHPGDDRYFSHVGVDPFIVLPNKADNRTKTPWDREGFMWPHLSVGMHVCMSVSVHSYSFSEGP